MITPNKVITLRESALGRIPILLRHKGEGTDLIALYRDVSKDFESIDQFLLSLDILFILGRIDIDLQTGVVANAD
jgi:hypothetical protein